MRIDDVVALNKVRSVKLGFVNKFVNWCNSAGWFFRLISKCVFHVELPSGLKDVRMGHPFFVVINGNCKVGRNLTVYQGVTIGEKVFGKSVGVPEIGDDVIIYPNSVVVGGIKIGDRSVIGAGSVVVNDVRSGAVVAGNPARELFRFEDCRD